MRQQYGQTGNPGADARKNFRGFDQGTGKTGDHMGANKGLDSATRNRSTGQLGTGGAGTGSAKQGQKATDQRKDFRAEIMPLEAGNPWIEVKMPFNVIIHRH